MAGGRAKQRTSARLSGFCFFSLRGFSLTSTSLNDITTWTKLVHLISQASATSRARHVYPAATGIIVWLALPSPRVQKRARTLVKEIMLFFPLGVIGCFSFLFSPSYITLARWELVCLSCRNIGVLFSHFSLTCVWLSRFSLLFFFSLRHWSLFTAGFFRYQKTLLCVFLIEVLSFCHTRVGMGIGTLSKALGGFFSAHGYITYEKVGGAMGLRFGEVQEEGQTGRGGGGKACVACHVRKRRSGMDGWGDVDWVEIRKQVKGDK